MTIGTSTDEVTVHHADGTSTTANAQSYAAQATDGTRVAVHGDGRVATPLADHTEVSVHEGTTHTTNAARDTTVVGHTDGTTTVLHHKDDVTTDLTFADGSVLHLHPDGRPIGLGDPRLEVHGQSGGASHAPTPHVDNSYAPRRATAPEHVPPTTAVSPT